MAYILGAGGFAAELQAWLEADGLQATVEGFVTDPAYVASNDVADLGLPVMAFEDAPAEPASFYLGVSDPALKRKFVSQALALGWRPLSYLSRQAIVSSRAALGPGVVVCPFSTVSPLSKLGDYVTVNCHSGIGHHARVGAYASLLGANSVNGHAEIGSDCLLGSGAQVHPKRKVGDGAVVGIGAVVISHVPPGRTVFGNPARSL